MKTETENRNKVNILSEYKIKIPDFDSQESGIFVGKILKLKAVESKIKCVLYIEKIRNE